MLVQLRGVFVVQLRVRGVRSGTANNIHTQGQISAVTSSVKIETDTQTALRFCN